MQPLSPHVAAINDFYTFICGLCVFLRSSKLPAVVVSLHCQLVASEGSTPVHPPTAPVVSLIKPGVIGVSLEG